MKTGIYTITCKINNKIYVGSTITSFKKRWYRHLMDLRSDKHRNLHLQNSFNLYGEENFIFEILEQCDKSLCRDVERYWITMLNTKNKKIGYNIHDPIRSGINEPRSKETKQKISNTLKGRIFPEEVRRKIGNANKGKDTWTKGRKLTEEHRKNIGEGNKGKILSKETKKRISIAKNNMSQETKKKMSESAKKRWEMRKLNKIA